MVGAIMKARPLVRVCVITAFTVGSAYAQPIPPRDRLPPPATGTAVIKGRVVDAQAGNALPRARVRLPGPGNRPTVLTDETGVVLRAGTVHQDAVLLVAPVLALAGVADSDALADLRVELFGQRALALAAASECTAANERADSRSCRTRRANGRFNLRAVD